jgi:glycerol-3-phosphate acyltransferase PlsX
MTIRIAVDAMGGDNAPRVVVNGLHHLPEGLDVEILVVGRPEEIAACGDLPAGAEVVPATDVVDMHDAPREALRKKRKSSLAVSVGLVREGRADAVVSLGNTGAFMAFCVSLLSTLPGIRRPAIAVPIPTARGHCLLLDAGATSDSRPAQLRDFALMGKVYCEQVMGIESPKVGLLSLGEESSKGNERTFQATEMIRELPLEFVGNVEGDDIPRGEVDVVVCDGFTGNVVLKFGEGLMEMVLGGLQGVLESQVKNPGDREALESILKGFMAKTDYAEYGGAPLLGVQGTVIIGHGRSAAKAVANAVRAAHRAAQHRVNELITREAAALETSGKEAT